MDTNATFIHCMFRVWICFTLWLLPGTGEAQPREVALEVESGYGYKEAVKLLKRNLRLQGWQLTESKSAHWKIKLCQQRATTSTICVQQGAQWQRLTSPRRQLSPSTRARLLLLYFNMLHNQPAGQRRATSAQGCTCQPSSTRKKKQRRSRPITNMRSHNVYRGSVRHNKAKRQYRETKVAVGSRVIPKRKTPPKPTPWPPRTQKTAQKADQEAAPTVRAVPVALPVQRQPPAIRIAKANQSKEAIDLSDMVGTKSLPSEDAYRWRGWLTAGISAGLYFTDAVNWMPGGTAHIHAGWGKVGIHISLELHAFVLKSSNSILLVRPAFQLEWNFQPGLRIGGAHLLFGLQAGVSVEHRVDQDLREGLKQLFAKGQPYLTYMQWGPTCGLQLLVEWRSGWAVFWHSSLAIYPGMTAAEFEYAPMFQWKNMIGIQYALIHS